MSKLLILKEDIMKHGMKYGLILSLFLAVLVLSVGTPALATNLPRILIAGEDSDSDTIPRDSRVFKRVLNAISNTLVDEGYDVKDETALTHATHIQGRTRRTDAELVQIAKDVGIDVLVIFSIYPDAKTNANSVRVTARVEGRLLSVDDGSRMGNFETEPQNYQTVPKPYSRNDILEGVGKISKIIGREVGAVLTERLTGYVDKSGGHLLEWTLIFDGYNDDEMIEMEDYLIIFSGYDSHRPKKNGLNTSLHHEYLYKSSIDSAKLKRNMHKMLKKLNFNGRSSMSGNEILVKKIKRVKQRQKKTNSEW
jgi:hypothetical protein